MSTGTVRLHRVLKCSPERIYRAFLEPGALSRWLPPYGFICQVHELNPVVGGSFRATFTNFGTSGSHSFSGEYLELKPFESIRYYDQFDNPDLPGRMNVSVFLRAVVCGTELAIVQEGIPAAIPTELCYLGWQESLEQLARLVEPDIKDE